MEDCPTLIARLHDDGVLQPPPTQKLQMMRSKPHEEDPNVNIVLRSGIMTGDDKDKQPKDSTWVRKAPAKEVEFDLERAQETFMDTKKSFTDASTSGSKDRLKPEMDPSMLMMLLETCMKLLCNTKAVKGLHELINICAGTAPGEPRIVQKIGKHVTRTGREMRLTA